MNEQFVLIASVAGTAISAYFAYKANVKGSKVVESKNNNDYDAKRIQAGFDGLKEVVGILQQENRDLRARSVAQDARIDALFNEKMSLAIQLQTLTHKYNLLELELKTKAV